MDGETLMGHWQNRHLLIDGIAFLQKMIVFRFNF